MAGKNGSMALFVIALVIGGPVSLISGALSLAWGWEYIRGCFFSLSYYCGQGDVFKAVVFAAVAAGCVTWIKSSWDKSK